MGAVNPKFNEPSMEEILASIRRIIADDQEALQEAHQPELSSDLSPLRNVLDITERQVIPQAVPVTLPLLPEIEHEPAVFASTEDDYELRGEIAVPDFSIAYKIDQAPVQPMARSKPRSEKRAEPISEDTLLSDETDVSVSDAFSRLGSTVASSSPKTLEDLAREMLRPMLKAWLDDNLPPLVERLVQAEIERVSRGKR
jgi:cell pole-organizing protein PopZ